MPRRYHWRHPDLLDSWMDLWLILADMRLVLGP